MRGVGEKTIDMLKKGGYLTVEDIARETDLKRLGDVDGIGIKKARQIKAAAENYLLEEQRKRAELDGQKAAAGGPLASPAAPAASGPVTPTPTAPPA